MARELKQKLDEEMAGIVQALKEELDHEDQWVYGVGLKLEELEEVLRQETGTIGVRILVKMEEADLVDGVEVDFCLEGGEEGLQLDLGFTEDSPAYSGGTIEEGLKWLSRGENLTSRSLIHLDMREEKYSSYR